SFSVLDNGHTVQVNVAPGNGITVMGRRFELLQFHFHRPSEERVNGRQFDMVAHLVHRDEQGRLAVVAVLL
ncbi:carbonic anhydrase family protein, partial [Klebsiella pneumoniae]